MLSLDLCGAPVSKMCLRIGKAKRAHKGAALSVKLDIIKRLDHGEPNQDLVSTDFWAQECSFHFMPFGLRGDALLLDSWGNLSLPREGSDRTEGKRPLLALKLKRGF